MNIQSIKGVLWSNFIDGETASLRALEYVLWATYTDKGARKLVGFKKVIPFWGTHPGWYLKIENRRGIYGLYLLKYGPVEMRKALRPGDEGLASFSYSHFTLKYYPYPEEPVFRNYGFFEKVIRLSDLFDKEGLPKEALHLEAYDSVRPSYYAIGNLELYFEKASRAVCIVLTTQDKWIEYREEGLEVETPDGKLVMVIKPGERDRYIAGLRVSWHLFDKIIKAFCYSYEASPTAVLLINSPGRIWHMERSNKSRVEYSQKCLERKLIVGIPLILEQTDKAFFTKMLENAVQQEVNFARSRGELKNVSGKLMPTLRKLYMKEFKDLEKPIKWERLLNREWWEIGGRPSKRYVYKV